MINLRLGQVVHDMDGHPWVYVGYRHTTVGSTSRIFVKAERGAKPEGPTWNYHAVKRATLIKRFPDLAPLWPEEELWG